AREGICGEQRRRLLLGNFLGRRCQGGRRSSNWRRHSDAGRHGAHRGSGLPGACRLRRPLHHRRLLLHEDSRGAALHPGALPLGIIPRHGLETCRGRHRATSRAD
ncbi:unnamed protein product, partial [Symbiodinium necroappetens]